MINFQVLTRILFYTVIRLNIFGSFPVVPRLRRFPVRGLLAIFLFLSKSLGVGDLSLDNSDTTSVEVPLLLVLVFCVSSQSLSEPGCVDAELTVSVFMLSLISPNFAEPANLSSLTQRNFAS